MQHGASFVVRIRLPMDKAQAESSSTTASTHLSLSLQSFIVPVGASGKGHRRTSRSESPGARAEPFMDVVVISADVGMLALLSPGVARWEVRGVGVVGVRPG